MSYYKPGSWNVICDECGFEFKSHQLHKRWDGLMVCREDWEPDHPQKYLRVTEDNQTVPFVKPEPEDTFVDVCYIYAISAYAGLAEAGCAQAGVQTLPYATLLALKGS